MNHGKIRSKRISNKIVYIFSNKMDQSTALQMIGLTFFLFTIYVWQLQGCSLLSFTFYFSGSLLLYFSSLAAIRFKNANLQFHKNTVLLMVLEIISLIYIFINNSIIVGEIGGYKEYIIILGMLIVIIAQGVQLFLTIHKWKLHKNNRVEIIWLGITCFIFAFLLNIECFNTWPRWDTYNYLRSIRLLSARNIFLPGENGLKICGHTNIAYGLWVLMFRPISGNTSLNALYFSNMVLVAIDLVLLYLIFNQMLSDEGFFWNLFYAVIVVCSPWVLGHVADINAELFTMTAILLLLYAIFSNNNMLSILAIFVLCNARETGVPMAAMAIFAQFLYAVFGYIRNKERMIDWGYYVLCFGVGFLWLLQYRMGNWSDRRQASISFYWATLDGHELNRFGFSPVHVKDSLTGILITNFNWILSALLVLALGFVLLQLIRKEKRVSQLLSKKEYWITVAVLIVYIVVICAYITCHIYRYFIVSSVLICILGLCSARHIFQKVSNGLVFSHVLSIVIAVLLLVQSYRSIDPITARLYPAIETGETVVVPLPQHTNIEKDPFFADWAYSNRQIMYFDKALDRAYAAIYDESAVENTQILCSNEYQGRIIEGNVHLGSLFSIWGFGYSKVDPPMWGEWDSEGRYRYLSFEPENIIDPEYVLADTDLSRYINDYEHVYYIEMPWGDTVIDALQEKYSSISYIQAIEYRGWVLKIYQIK